MIIKKIENKFYEYSKGVEFQIQPLRFSTVNLDAVTDSVKEQFEYCLMGWKGLTDENDEEFKYNEENKTFLYDYYKDVREFVFKIVNEIQAELDGDLKN